MNDNIKQFTSHVVNIKGLMDLKGKLELIYLHLT